MAKDTSRVSRSQPEVIVPKTSPVLKKGKKSKRIEGKFAPMREAYFRLTDSEFKVFAAMLLLGGWRNDCRVITNSMIQELTGKGKATIERAQAGLKAKGFIVRQSSPKKMGALWKVNARTGDILNHADLNLLFPDDIEDLTPQK